MFDKEHIAIRRALASVKVLLIGGDPRPDTIAKLKSSLDLSELIHCPTRRSDPSSRSFEYKLYTSDIALVVCARGLTRTQHGATLHRICREQKLPLLNCNHIPNVHSLVSGIAKARLTPHLVRRSQALTSLAIRSKGGAK